MDDIPKIQCIDPKGSGKRQQRKYIAYDADPAAQLAGKVYQRAVLAYISSRAQQRNEGNQYNQQ